MKTPKTSTITWSRLFKKFPFFKAYEHFIEIQVLAKKDEDHKKWQGFAESKLKNLLKHLEKFDEKIIGQCLELRPWPVNYRRKDIPEFPYNDIYYIGIRIRGGVIPKKGTIDFTATRKIFYEQFTGKMNENEVIYDLMMNKEIDLKIDYKTRAQLPDNVRPNIVPTQSALKTETHQR